ncbi:MAG: hypothetical protein ACR2KV_14405 [Solirubrobacteraceae bacterium]
MLRRVLVVLAGVSLVLSAGASSAAARPTKKVCGPPAAHAARCHAIVVTDAQGAPLATSTPVSGYAPADLQSAYGLTAAAASAGGSQTVAIVDAYDDPSAEADLATYRGNFGLPACTTANGCFRKRDEHGGTSYPAGNSGWAQEISLDLDMVSAICPNCRILLVEGASAGFTDLGTAVNTAATLGATQISNSYGGGEFSSESTVQTSYYKHPGIDVTVSSGDNGYGVEFPASSQYVTAVGGTSLTRTATARGWSETAWSGAGSGCSSYIVKPTWQKDNGCARRTVADVSAVADPNTGVAVYDSYGSGGTGWLVFGGTSVAAPVVAAVDALAGGRGGTAGAPLWGSFSYNNLALFTDVTAGSNGSCGATYLCTAKAGYDGPTGNGSPTPVSAAPPSPGPPANTALPAISGSTVQSSTLTASTGTWTNSPTSYAYQWSRCPSGTSCAPISGATASSYLSTAGDVGAQITVTVTASNGVGTPGTATSSPVGPVAAAPAQVVQNGGFESGALTPWTLAGAVEGITTGAPHSGIYAALLGAPTATNGDSAIAQTFTAPPASTTLSFYYAVSCPDSLTYDWATARLKDNGTGATTTVLAKTCNTANTWTKVSAAVTPGHSYTLTLVSHDDNYSADPTSTKFDDVAVS